MSDSGGVSIARSRSSSSGENRFYHPPPMRHRLQQATPPPSRVYRPRNTKSEKKKKKIVESDECAASTTASTNSKSSVESEKRVDAKITNLDRFLEFTTPRVDAQYLFKRNVSDRRDGGAEYNPYFVLGDLWESFKKWSAYGAGVPLMLDGDESVVQYYVPYLSGIQLYIDPKTSSRLRRHGEESDLDLSRETSSDGSTDYGAESGASNWSQQNLADKNVQRLRNLSLGINPSVSSSSDENEICSPPGDLVYEYLERDPPFTREPLADKILLLASRFPELRSYRSCDLSPSSWISVAWYPIYRIPVGPTLQSLDACFLTFHSLSTTANSTTACGPHSAASSFEDNHNSLKLSLHIFGLAFYKYRVAFWNSDAVQECQRASSLQRAADNWLKLLQVNHPDYNFFVSRNTYWK